MGVLYKGNGKENGNYYYIGVIQGLYKAYILGLYSYNGKAIGNYHSGFRA